MALYFIGIGLNDEKDITVKGVEAVQKCKYVYIEVFSSILAVPLSNLENFLGKKIIPADRELVEQTNEIVDNATHSDVAFLVIGDPFAATTHIDMMLRARERNVKFEIINNASILTAIGISGLQIYKFGKTTSIAFPQTNFRPITAY